MLSSDEKKARHEAACVVMRRLATDRRKSAWRLPQSVLSAEDKRRERTAFDRMGRYLDREAEQLAEEQRYNAFHAVRTSWPAIERAGLYGVFRRRDSVKARQFNSLRPIWGGRAPLLQFPKPSEDRHNLAFQQLPKAA